MQPERSTESVKAGLGLSSRSSCSLSLLESLMSDILRTARASVVLDSDLIVQI